MPAQKGSKLPPGPDDPGPLATLKWQRRVTTLMETSRQKYGHVWTMRLIGGATFVLVAEPRLIEGIYTADQTVLENEARLATPLLGKHSVIVLAGDEHVVARNLLAPLFRGERIQLYHHAIERITEEEIASWPLHESMSLLPRLRAITLNAIMSVVFGLPLDERHDRVRVRIRELLEWSGSSWHMAWFQAKFMRGWSPPHSFLQRRHRADEVIYEAIDRAREDPNLEQRDDVLATLLNARRDDGTALSREELRDQLITLLIQGHQSTANAVAFAIERVLRHPAVLERVTEEAHTSSGEYLDAVVKETLRSRPPQPFPVRRVVNQPYQLDGYELDPGTMVVVNIYMLHRREDIYPEPERFRPERFLEHTPGKYEWIPFGGGVRGCFGAGLAMAEMKIILGTLFRQAQLVAADPRDEPIVRRGVGFSPSEGARVVVTARTPVAKTGQPA